MNQQLNKKLTVFYGMILVGFLAAVAVGVLRGELGEEGSLVPEQGSAVEESRVGLSASLSVPPEVELCDPIPLVFTVTNQGDDGVYLLTWYTPLEGVAGNIFRISSGGEELAYQGPLAMRGDPVQDQYIFLEPGGSTSAEVDLSPYFDFSRPGEYLIAYRSPWISYAGPENAPLPERVDQLGPVKILSKPISLKVLPYGGGASCGERPAGEEEPGSSATPDAPERVVTGLVQKVSPSLKLIWLENSEGVGAIALTEETILLGEEGEPLELIELLPGMEIQASGRPGGEGVLVADQVSAAE